MSNSSHHYDHRAPINPPAATPSWFLGLYCNLSQMDGVGDSDGDGFQVEKLERGTCPTHTPALREPAQPLPPPPATLLPDRSNRRCRSLDRSLLQMLLLLRGISLGTWILLAPSFLALVVVFLGVGASALRWCLVVGGNGGRAIDAV